MLFTTTCRVDLAAIVYAIAVLPLVRAQSYCTTAPSSVYSPSYTLYDPNAMPQVTPPLPCPGVYAVQQGYCCSNGFDCLSGDGTCTCPNGTLVYSLPLAPCVTQNPDYSGCPGNMMAGLCCSGPGIFMGSDYNGTVSWPVCTFGTAVFNVTTAADGTVATTTLPPGISATNTICGTCPLYTRSSTKTSAGLAPRTQGPMFTRVAEVAALGALIGTF
ncbi:hypothetical protein MBLNU459_g2408t1 [Dothideomycetes sp. NU459]